MTFAKLLCPTDFSSGATLALETAIRLARDARAELVLVHVWYMPPPYSGHAPPLPPDYLQDAIDDAQRALDAAVRDAVAAGVMSVSGTLLTGVPWVQIVEELDRGAYDACVIGTQGRTGLARLLLGSVAEMVVRHAPCSVLAVRSAGEARPFEHALVPTDFSASAAYALDLAAELIRPDGAITLLHVVEQPVARRVASRMELASDLVEYAAAATQREVERVHRDAIARTRLGSAGAETLAALDEDPTIDVVVMGSHGRTGFKRAVMGSVAEKVVRHARCPVLVARRRFQRAG